MAVPRAPMNSKIRAGRTAGSPIASRIDPAAPGPVGTVAVDVPVAGEQAQALPRRLGSAHQAAQPEGRRFQTGDGHRNSDSSLVRVTWLPLLRCTRGAGASFEVRVKG